MHGLNFILLVATLGVTHADLTQYYAEVPVQYASIPEAVVPTIKAVGPENHFQYSASPSQTFATDPQYIKNSIPVETREPEPVVKYVSTMKQTIREPTVKNVSAEKSTFPESTLIRRLRCVKPAGGGCRCCEQ